MPGAIIEPASKIPIIAFGQNSWVGPWMNRQEILSRLAARGWPVVYSTGPLSIWQRQTQSWAEAGLRGTFANVDGVLVDLPGRALPRWPTMQPWDALVIRRHARRLRDAIGGSAGRDFILHVFDPAYAPNVEAINPRYLAFHVHDYYPGMLGWSKEDRAAMDNLAERADLVTLAGREMAECLPPAARRRARLLANGVDVDAYMAGPNHECPPDLAKIPCPRIGYIGAVSPKVDLFRVLALSRDRLDWHWVFIGQFINPKDIDISEHARLWSECLEQPNIHWLGFKDYRCLPAYVGHMDVNALIYRTNDTRLSWVPFTNPLKLLQALAVGKPVVSADLPSVREFSSVVKTVSSLDEWRAALEEALVSGGAGTPASRQAIALENSWEKRVDQLEAWFFELTGTGTATR